MLFRTKNCVQEISKLKELITLFFEQLNVNNNKYYGGNGNSDTLVLCDRVLQLLWKNASSKADHILKVKVLVTQLCLNSL